MRYYALASDYDGTLATLGIVDERVMDSLKELRNSGRKLVLVTGRQLGDLLSVFSGIDIFDRVVVENGALLYRPDTRQETALGEPPPKAFIDELTRRGVAPFSVGRVIINTVEPFHTVALEAIRDLGLELQVIFNKGEVMILPSSLNKAVGLSSALEELGLSPHNVVGVGDAENDHAFLKLCEAAAAVDNALPMLKEQADLVTQSPNGSGVVELVGKILKDDLAELAPRLTRHELLLGYRPEGEEVRIQPYGTSVLVIGASGAGKSTLATSFVEKLAEHAYQFCLIDPEGDYQELPQAVVLGDSKQPPVVAEVLDLLSKTKQNCVVSMYAIPYEDRPDFFERLYVELLELRTRTGRPHWIVMDEAHHLIPASWGRTDQNVPQDITGMMLISTYPERLTNALVSKMDVILATGGDIQKVFDSLSQTVQRATPSLPASHLQPGEAICWRWKEREAPFLFKVIQPAVDRRRHRRKYAEGELEPERSFFFRGPQGKLNLRADNLMRFIELGEGVDDETWEFHLKQGDYATWFREVIKDQDLVDAAEQLVENGDLSPEESRARLREAIESRYTGPG
jgi:HAD superfamily hydrolase (TIGR01484 family)